MKKILTLLLALITLFALTSCNQYDENVSTGENTSSTTDTTENTSNAVDGTEDADTTESTTGGDSVEDTESKPTEPKPTEPKPTEPKPTEPKPTEPKSTEPKPTEPKPTEPEVNNSSSSSIQQAEYERVLGEISIEYNRLVAEIQKEHNADLLNLAAAKLEAESQIGTLRAAYLSEITSLNNQKNALVREKDQALANALANTGGYYNSYYDTLKKQYDSRLASIDNQIEQINSKYDKKISEWQTYLNNLPTIEDYEYLRDIKLQDVENWKNEQIKNAQNYYGIT